eukprot:Pgem_evm1s450
MNNILILAVSLCFKSQVANACFGLEVDTNQEKVLSIQKCRIFNDMYFWTKTGEPGVTIPGHVREFKNSQHYQNSWHFKAVTDGSGQINYKCGNSVQCTQRTEWKNQEVLVTLMTESPAYEDEKYGIVNHNRYAISIVKADEERKFVKVGVHMNNVNDGWDQDYLWLRS